MARNAQNLLDMAAEILHTNATQRSTGLKNLLYAAPIQSGQKSMLIALVNGSHKERNQLFACAEEEGFLEALPVHLQPTSYTDKASFQIQVVLYECLLGSRRVRGTSKLVEFVKAHKKTLQMTLAERRKRGATHVYVPPVRMPRFVRVNHLKLSMADAVAYMESFDYKRVEPPADSSSNNYTSVVKPMTFMVDPFIPSLLVLPPNTSLHGDKQTEEGGLILQDRSSCLTAIALNPPPDAHCLDTCSSPGNKTLHLASIMTYQANTTATKLTGSIDALERSPNRFQTLCHRVEMHGASNLITPHEQDFMMVDTTIAFQDVTHVLIDPSCSGSGLVATYHGAVPSETDEYDGAEGVDSNNSGEPTAAVAALAQEQTDLILHAMTLPNAQVVAYSTCSIHRAENEDVVLAVLEAAKNDWKLVKAIPQWPHRGLDLPAFADIKDLVCRASLEQDGTNGFFVARFEKVAVSAISKTDDDTTAEKEEKKEEASKNQPASVGSDSDSDSDDDDKVVYKQVKKATKKMLKKADGKSMKYKSLQKALREKLGMDKKKLRKVMDKLVAKEDKKFLLESKHLRLVST